MKDFVIISTMFVFILNINNNNNNYMMKCVSNLDNGISCYTAALESIHTPSLLAHFIVLI